MRKLTFILFKIHDRRSKKYRTQKKSTVRKFEATRNDLERVQDIIAEVEQKVRSLDLQLKRFKRHASLIEKLESKDIELAFVQIHRFKSTILPLHLKIEEFRHLRESKSNAIRADILIFTKCPENLTKQQSNDFVYKSRRFLGRNVPILFSCIDYKKPIKIYGNKFHF